jgi:hypothetical protein
MTIVLQQLTALPKAQSQNRKKYRRGGRVVPQIRRLVPIAVKVRTFILDKASTR